MGHLPDKEARLSVTAGPDIIFIRTHRFGPQEDRLACQLELFFGAGNVAICADESHGEIDTGRWPKSGLTAARIDRMIGPPIPKDWGWRMGDLCHIAIAEDFGPRAHQWLIENDVHIPQGSEQKIFSRLTAIDADFMACNLAPKKVKNISEAVTIALPSADMGCIFAFNRLKGTCVPELVATRRKISAGLVGAKRKTPNDEAVLANLGVHAGWTMVDLYAAAPEVFSPSWFSTNPPILRDALDRRPAGDIRICHPVLSFEQVMKRVSSRDQDGHPQKYGMGRLGRLMSELPDDQRQQLRAALDLNPGVPAAEDGQ